MSFHLKLNRSRLEDAAKGRSDGASRAHSSARRRKANSSGRRWKGGPMERPGCGSAPKEGGPTATAGRAVQRSVLGAIQHPKKRANNIGKWGGPMERPGHGLVSEESANSRGSVTTFSALCLQGILLLLGVGQPGLHGSGQLEDFFSVCRGF